MAKKDASHESDDTEDTDGESEELNADGTPKKTEAAAGTEGAAEGEGEGEGEGDDAESEEDKRLPKDLPTALAQLQEAQREIRRVNRESAGRRKLLKAQTEELTKLKAGGGDTAKELAKATADLAAAQAQLREAAQRSRFDAAIAKSKKVFATDKARNDAFDFVKSQLAELADDAPAQDVLDIINDEIAARPYLLKVAEKVDTNAEKRGKQTPAALKADLIDKKRTADYGGV